MNPTKPSTTRSAAKRPIAAVTGASGFIGSHLCQNLLEHGYVVRACVRTPTKAGHLLALQDSFAGRLEVCVADMSMEGAYDEIFGNHCEYVFHVAGNFGTDYHLWKSKRTTSESTTNIVDDNENAIKGRLPPMDELWKEIHSHSEPQQQQQQDSSSQAASGGENPDGHYSYDHAVYESYVLSMEWLLQSVAKHQDTIQKVVYTSSGAAGGTISGKAILDHEEILEHAYGTAKRDCEAMLYEFCSSRNVVGVSVCPCIVLGPLMTLVHDSVYQHRLADMLRGRYTLRQDWEIADVRDIAETQRLAAEAPNLPNGTRFWNGSEPSWKVSDILNYINSHKQFQNDNRLSPILLQEDEESSGDSGSGGGSGSESGSQSGSQNGSDSGSGSGSETGSGQDSERDNKEDKQDDDGNSSSCSSSCASEDSFGIAQWEGENPTTTWSNPVIVFADSYKPRTPQQTVVDTSASILERWDSLGRELTLKECSNYYTVAEMDGCEEEMEWLKKEILLRFQEQEQQQAETTTKTTTM